MSELTAKQKQFCIEYLKDFNGTQAAIRAGYSKDTANEQSSRLLINVNVKKKIQKLADEILGNDIKFILENVYFWQSVRDDKEQSTTDRLKASDLLGKYKAMFTEKIEHSGGVNINIEVKDV